MRILGPGDNDYVVITKPSRSIIIWRKIYDWPASIIEGLVVPVDSKVFGPKENETKRGGDPKDDPFHDPAVCLRSTALNRYSYHQKY